MDNLQLRFSKEIKVGDFIIKIPTTQQIIDIGEAKYREHTMPYSISKNILRCDKEVLDGIRDFDLFFLLDSSGKYLLNHETEDHKKIPFIDILLESLEFYFQEKVSLLSGKDLKDFGITDLGYNNDILSSVFFILIENNGVISRENFDDIANIMLKLNGSKKMEFEPEPEFKNDRQRDIYNKIMEGRRRKTEKDSRTIADMIDVVQFGGKSFISYDEVSNFTIQQLIHAYITILSIDSFNINFGQYQAGAEPSKLDLEHWANKIKQINSQ